MSEQQVFEPLPCPFCGSHNVKPYEYLSGVEDAFCQCADCGSMGPSGKHATKDSAVAEWNQRAALPRPAPQGVAEVMDLVEQYAEATASRILSTASTRPEVSDAREIFPAHQGVHMTTITLDAIEARQSELAAMIAAFRDQAPRAIIFPETTIELQPGEHYAGAVLDENDQIKHHLVLMAARPNERQRWDDAMAWAQSVDGSLPDRQEQALLFANCKPYLAATWHWSCKEYEGDASSAWHCNFDSGYQNASPKSFKGSAVAVRRV